MIRLAVTRPQDLRGLLPMPPDQAHALLVAEAAKLSPAHAALFAQPVVEEGGIAWVAPGARMARYADLDAASRAALTAEAGRILSDLRREAEAGRPIARLWPAIAEIPSFDLLFAVDGRPVLAAWGHVGAAAPGPLGLLARFDDGIAWQPPPRRPWGVWIATLAALALLALLAGLLAPLIAWRFLEPPQAACIAAEGDLAAVARLIEAERGERDLRTELARLEAELGRRRLACPLPRAPDPPPPAPEPPPPPPEPPRGPPPGTQPCNVETQSGGQGETRTRHYLGPTPGPVTLDYDTQTVPDQIEVRYRGRVIASTPGMVSGRGRIGFDWRPQGNDYVVEVVVIGPFANTRWRYRLNCPEP
jgi:hypothetical protein